MDQNGIAPALIISVVSLVIALLALIWNILNATLLDRARLDVRIDFGMRMVGGAPGTDRTVVAISATNIGRRPVRLTGLWLAFGRPPVWWRHFVPRRWQEKLLPNIALMNPGGDRMLASMSTTLPLMLGIGEAANIYDYEQARVFEAARENGEEYAYARAFGSTTGGWSKRVRIPYPDA